MVQRWVPDRGDIISIDFDPQMGREMKARHPVLVLSPRIVNGATSTVIGLPMCSHGYNATNPFAVTLDADGGEVGYLIANQQKPSDWRQRGARAHPWKRAPADVLEQVCDKLNRIISICAG
jgi:mRNA interferase MazF